MASVPPGFKPGIANLERAWGCSPDLIADAQWSGMDAIDLETLQDFCRTERKLLIFRAPGGNGRDVRGLGLEIRPKPAWMKQKTHGSWIVDGGRFYTSDWDLLSAWQRSGAGYSRYELAADTRQTTEFLKRINRQTAVPAAARRQRRLPGRTGQAEEHRNRQQIHRNRRNGTYRPLRNAGGDESVLRHARAGALAIWVGRSEMQDEGMLLA